LIPPPLSRRFEKCTTRVRSRLSWKAKTNADEVREARLSIP
jgi:hypothetical protein